LRKLPSTLDEQSILRLIDSDMSVENNYKRLAGSVFHDIFDETSDELSVKQIREALIGTLNSAMNRVFSDLNLRTLGHPLENGNFFFEKGESKNFHYKNLSGGEKAAFDMLLDFVVKRDIYDDTIFCIDEPELHMHTKLQGRLLEELLLLLPENCQLWIASHAIGVLRKAQDLQIKKPNEVVFLDFHDKNFDEPIILRPTIVDRKFWKSMLDVALDDLATLVAPSCIVLCEGRPAKESDIKAEFDAECYRTIFQHEYPDTDFVSVGNAFDVQSDRLAVGKTIQTIIRLLDRDDRSTGEIKTLLQAGIHVLSRRHIEAYLMDDEILIELCRSENQSHKQNDVLSAKALAIQASIKRGNPVDDVKSATGEIYNAIKQILNLTQKGSNHHVFMKEVLAPLVLPDTRVYTELKQDIFGV
jgi:hypothetical protein